MKKKTGKRKTIFELMVKGPEKGVPATQLKFTADDVKRVHRTGSVAHILWDAMGGHSV